MKNSEVEQKEIEVQNQMNDFCLKEGKPELIQDYKITAIGWLDSSEFFERGDVSNYFLNKLKLLWEEGGCIMTLGFHECEFCESVEKAKSSKEKILIDNKNKVKYIIPEMIFHYIEVHKFKPSDEFIEFVIRS